MLQLKHTILITLFITCGAENLILTHNHMYLHTNQTFNSKLLTVKTHLFDGSSTPLFTGLVRFHVCKNALLLSFTSIHLISFSVAEVILVPHTILLLSLVNC